MTTVLTTLPELEKFSISTTCVQCANEAREMIQVLTQEGVNIQRLVFDATCEHSAGPMASTVDKVLKNIDSLLANRIDYLTKVFPGTKERLDAAIRRAAEKASEELGLHNPYRPDCVLCTGRAGVIERHIRQELGL